MIRIKEVKFENYRQYRNITINFDASSQNNLYVLRAKNGTGKTTFLNGILWCLYEKEYYLNDEDKALPIVNSSFVQQSKENESLVARVLLTIDDGLSTLCFERSQNFLVTVHPSRETKSAVAVPGSSKLKITITPNNAVTNTRVYEDNNDVQNIVKQYFDEAIYDYYFFDGENLKNYFAKGKSKRIKESIHNISQVTLLTNAISHVEGMSIDKSRQVARIASSDDSIYQEIEDLTNRIKRLEAENSSIESELPQLEKKRKEADDILVGYRPIRANTQERENLNKEIASLKRDFDSFKVEKQNFIRESLIYLNFYPRVKRTLEIIKEKQKAGTLPPSIDKDQVKQILENHTANCPVCNSVIDDAAIIHLQELIKQLDVSSATSNFLMEIKGSLEQIIERCKSFPQNLAKIIQKEKYYVDEIDKKQRRIEVINSFLVNHTKDGKGAIDVPKVEAQRSQCADKINSYNVRHALNERDIKTAKSDLELKEKERKQIEDRNTTKNDLNDQVKVYRKLTTLFKNVQKNIMDNIKEDIEFKTWESFDSMIWKKNTFGNIEIDDSYALSVFDRDGNEMTGGLSATEYMALAYSFTLAIHEASGKNCPLVVDSPLGRVSDENRTNMASELLKVSKTKQIIMLFTPDEYSEEVKKLYDVCGVTIQDIVLSADEKEISRVGFKK